MVYLVTNANLIYQEQAPAGSGVFTEVAPCHSDEDGYIASIAAGGWK